MDYSNLESVVVGGSVSAQAAQLIYARLLTSDFSFLVDLNLGGPWDRFDKDMAT